jgi:hypothetical protein
MNTDAEPAFEIVDLSVSIGFHLWQYGFVLRRLRLRGCSDLICRVFSLGETSHCIREAASGNNLER